jgi:anti-sigma28 factor (negative regulator of flagellin synthesis)
MENLLNLSDPSQVVTLLLGMLAEADGRERKLASLRSSITAGTYRVPAELIADAVVRSAQR